MKDKQVFKLEELDSQGLADSYGLANAPEIKLMNSQGEELGNIEGEKKSKVQKLREKIEGKEKAKQESALKQSEREMVA